MPISLNNNYLVNHSFLLGIIVWWTGLGGRDLYMLPIVFSFGFASYKIFSVGRLADFDSVKCEQLTFFTPKKLLLLLFLHGVIMGITAVFKLYSFSWNIWDTGIYSDIIYNTSKGQFFSSYYQTHNWGDHFTPSMSIISPLYWIIPSANWMNLTKVLAYVTCPILIWKLSHEIILDKRKSKLTGIVCSLYWLYFYAPIVNSSNFAFHPSSLAAPFIFFSMLLILRKRWIELFFVFLFLIGLKEHLGSVLIGFGCYMVLNTNHIKGGVLNILLGTSAIIITMWIIMPYYRNYEAAWTTGNIENISLFYDVEGKLKYLLKLLLPFGFIPLFYWKYGILAGPAIGVNLLATSKGIYSTSFHYDDLNAPLLCIVMILSVNKINFNNIYNFIYNKKWMNFVFVLWIGLVCALFPESPLREFRKTIPSSSDLEILKEVNKFNELTEGKKIAVQSSLGPLFNRMDLHWYLQWNGNQCSMDSKVYKIKSIPVDYVLLAPGLGHYGIDDMEKCIKNLSENDKIIEVQEFKHIRVFKRSS